MNTATSEAKPAFSRPLAVDAIPDAGLETTIEATTPECMAVAAEIGLPAVGALSARCAIVPRSGGRFHIGGEVKAHITQICTISLDPFESAIEAPIDATLAPVASLLPDRHIVRAKRPGKRSVSRQTLPSSVPSAEAESDPPDPILDGRIELGALAVEFLTLALDFYPRKPGVQFRDVIIGETDEPKPSVFAALERLKDRS